MEPGSNKKIPKNYQRLNGSKLEPAHGASLVGPVDAKETLSVSIYIRSKPEAPPPPDLEYWITNPPGHRKFLTRKEFEAQYGADQSELAMAAEFARSHGLDVKEINAARRVVIALGTVDQMNKAFAVKLGYYESPTQKYHGIEGHIHIPGHLIGIVEAVFGLDNRKILGIGGGVPPAGTPITPRDVARIYNFPLINLQQDRLLVFLHLDDQYPNHQILGRKLAMIQTIYNTFSLTKEYAHYCREMYLLIKLPPIPPILLTIGRPTDQDKEITADIEIAGSVADGARIVVYFAQEGAQGFRDAFSVAVHDAQYEPSVLTTSWVIFDEKVYLTPTSRISRNNSGMQQ